MLDKLYAVYLCITIGYVYVFYCYMLLNAFVLKLYRKEPSSPCRCQGQHKQQANARGQSLQYLRVFNETSSSFRH